MLRCVSVLFSFSVAVYFRKKIVKLNYQDIISRRVRVRVPGTILQQLSIVPNLVYHEQGKFFPLAK